MIVENLTAADQQDLLRLVDLELTLDLIGERAHVLDAIGQVEYVPRARVHSTHVDHHVSHRLSNDDDDDRLL